jgi:hypothetical protein
LSGTDGTAARLWLGGGLYHGGNPGMGWPLAVSAGLMEKSPRAVFLALWPLSVGHLLAMLLTLLPFALLLALAEWQREIPKRSVLVVIGFGIFLLLERRHPEHWQEYRRRNWRSGHSRSPLRMVPD